MLSLTTDYVKSTEDPSPYLCNIGKAGFSHIHWCHQWNTDFLYSKWEIEQIARWLDEYGIKLLDLHGSAGKEKGWMSAKEYERLAGVELVQNRIDMTATLGGGVVIMHISDVPGPEPLRKSLDELEPFARERSIRIAVENGKTNFDAIEWVLEHYDAGYVGVCYDSGHGNMAGDGLDRLDRVKDRLISVHLHDNDGEGDLHNPIFSGTTDWQRLAGIMAKSSYTGPVSSEASQPKSGIEDEWEFLRVAFDVGTRFAAMIEEAKKKA